MLDCLEDQHFKRRRRGIKRRKKGKDIINRMIVKGKQC